jgi:hypothetical protein
VCGVYRYWNRACWSFPVLTIEENKAQAEDCLSKYCVFLVYSCVIEGGIPFYATDKSRYVIHVSRRVGLVV